MRRNQIQHTQVRFFVAAAVLCAGTALLGCSENDEPKSPQSVKTEINPDLDFATFETFDLVDPLGDVPETDAGVPDAGTMVAPLDLAEINDEILTEIESQMTGLGLTKDTDNPDLKVSYYVNEEAAETSITFYDYFYGYYWGYEFTWTFNIEYDAGTMIIDVVDTSADPNVLAFRGIAEGVLARNQDVRLIQMRNAVNAVFNEWPETEEEKK